MKYLIKKFTQSNDFRRVAFCVAVVLLYKVFGVSIDGIQIGILTLIYFHITERENQ